MTLGGQRDVMDGVWIDKSCSLAIAAPQPIENQQRSYEVFEKKHYMECTTYWNHPLQIVRSRYPHTSQLLCMRAMADDVVKGQDSKGDDHGKDETNRVLLHVSQRQR